MNCVQTLKPCVLNVSYSEIGMQRFLEAERSCPRISDYQLQAQLGTNRRTMDQMKVSGPPSLRIVIAFGEHADRNCIPGLLDRINSARHRTHESVHRSTGIF